MTPEEKAKELVERYSDLFETPLTRGMKFQESKEAALICVNEIINANPYYFFPGRKVTRVEDHSTKDFWQQVKEQINKL